MAVQTWMSALAGGVSSLRSVRALLKGCASRQTASGSERNQGPVFEEQGTDVFNQQKGSLVVGPQKPAGLPCPLGTQAPQAEMDLPPLFLPPWS